MRKILATIWKEWLLARRDLAGFMLLFLMPATLIIVMALIQDAPFKDYQEMKFELLVADHDHGSVAGSIREGLKQSGNFVVIDSIEGAPVTAVQMEKLLQEGEYKVGLVIPEGITAEMVNSANLLANTISEKLGLGSMPSREPRDGMAVRMYFDPVTKPTYRMSISFALDKLITSAGSRILIERLSRLGLAQADSGAKVAVEGQMPDFDKAFRALQVHEYTLGNKAALNTQTNSVQHNVPAWAIFGMFFIVIPMCGHQIKEREDGSAIRLELIPHTRRAVALGKILFYTLVCVAQFYIMSAVGIWVLPQLGLPSLSLGVHPWALMPAALAIAFAATSYGYFIGSVFKTTNQALPFGAISVVILSAMGGIWVPADLFSPALQKMAMISPLYWGLDAINFITIRGGNVGHILPHLSVLFGFSTIMWMVSTHRNKKRTHSVQ